MPPHHCDRCSLDWTTRPNSQFANGHTTLAECRLNLTNTLPYTLSTLCSECYAHYEYAVVGEVFYIDFDEDDDDDEEDDEDEDPSSSDDTDVENDIVCCDPE